MSRRRLCLWRPRRRRRQGADLLPGAGVILAELHDRLGRLHALTLVQEQWPAFSEMIVDFVRLAYVDGLADGAAEDTDGLVDCRDRSDRTAAYAAAVRSASDGFVQVLAGGAVRIFETNDALWGELVTVLDRAGVTVDDGLAALGAPRLAAVFRQPSAPIAQRQEMQHG